MLLVLKFINEIKISVFARILKCVDRNLKIFAKAKHRIKCIKNAFWGYQQNCTRSGRFQALFYIYIYRIDRIGNPWYPCHIPRVKSCFEYRCKAGRLLLCFHTELKLAGNSNKLVYSTTLTSLKLHISLYNAITSTVFG